MDASELRLTDIPRRSGGLLAVSQSGETKDLLRALKHAELAGVARLSVVNAVGSAIARETVSVLYSPPAPRPLLLSNIMHHSFASTIFASSYNQTRWIYSFYRADTLLAVLENDHAKLVSTA